MDNNIYITNKTKSIAELLISYILKTVKEKRECGVYNLEYSRCSRRLSTVSRELMNFDIIYEKRMKNLYNDLDFSYSRTGYGSNYVGYHRRASLIREKSKLSNDVKTIRRKLVSSSMNYKDAQNKLDNYLNNLTEIDLRGLIEYFDINIGNLDDINIKGIMIDELKKNMIEDFERILKYDIKLPNGNQYRGKIYFIEILINQKNNYEIKMKEYNTEKEKANKLQLLLDKNKELLKMQSSKIEEIECFVFNKLFKRSKLALLKEELKITDEYVKSCITNLNLINNHLVALNQDIIIAYKSYNNIYREIDEVIDELSESSLEKLMNLLNIKINIVKTNDKYFNVKNEMRKELRKYLHVEEIEPIIQNQNNEEDINKIVFKFN